MSRRELKLVTFARMAIQLMDLSTCSKAAVSCLIVDKNFNSIESIGYNGWPTNFEHEDCKPDNDPCGCVHAEINACLKLNTSKDCIAIVTKEPCIRCAQCIIQSSVISHVIIASSWEDTSLEPMYIPIGQDFQSVELLRKAKIKVNGLKV